MSQAIGLWKRWAWTCPGNDVLAGYMDGALDDGARCQIQSHLADCAACRSLIGDVAMMPPADDVALPLGLKRRAIASMAPTRKIRASLVLPAAAASTVVAKSEPPSWPGPTTTDMARKNAPLESLPTLISPRDGGVIKPSELVLHWKPVPQTRYYEIHVVTFDGDPVWQGESQKNNAKLSPNIVLKEGTYFAWIAACLDDGRVQKSAPVRFVVNFSR
ncbi:MAG: hypothetical protein DMG93_18275 [Acidobacteria bacterium]|nr:MAG: hypothetical protein DMG93_18275 [Acidobacteriota bacterium]